MGVEKLSYPKQGRKDIGKGKKSRKRLLEGGSKKGVLYRQDWPR